MNSEKRQRIEVESDEAEVSLSESEVEVDFEAFPPIDDDYRSIKLMLHQLFATLNVDIDDLTKLILAQKHVGCVIKQADDLAEDDCDDDLFGMLTVLSISHHKDSASIQDIKSLLTSRNPPSDSDTLSEMISCLNNTDGKNTGLIINQRLLNIPPQLAPPLYKSLAKDIAEANTNDNEFIFHTYLYFCKAFIDADIDNKMNKSKTTASLKQVQFANPEDQIFFKESSCWYYFPVSESSGMAGGWDYEATGLVPLRAVCMLPHSRWDSARLTVQTEFSV